MLTADRTRAETCECASTSFSWSGCDEEACDPGGWNFCTPSPDDAFRINGGCAVRIEPQHDVLLQQATGVDIRVAEGGSLEVDGPVELRVGPSGLQASAGSSVSLRGCFRDAAGSCTPDLGPSALFKIGTVMPCRDWLCDDDANVVRLLWNQSDTSAEEWARLGSLLASLDAERDVLCFWQTSEYDVGADSGYCYRMIGVSTASPRWLDFDVRQVWNAQSDQAGFPLERRLVREVHLAEDHPAGARWLRMRETTAVSTRSDGIGRWIRCDRSQRAYVIASVSDDLAGDAILLADRRGLKQAAGAGATCHIDWGWSRGDVAFVMAPVHVTTTSRAGGEGFLNLWGDVMLESAVIDGLGGSGYRGGVWLYGARLLGARHVWVMDPLTANGQTITLEDVQCGAEVNHLLITGGPEAPEDDKDYGLAVMGGPACTYYVNHLYTRHRGDDNLLTNSSGVAPTGTVVWHWVQGGPASVPGDSGQFMDFGTGNVTNVYGSDGLCTACTSQDGLGSLMIPSGSGQGLMERLLWLGATGQGFSAAAVSVSNPQFRYRDVGVIGSAVDPAYVGRGQLVGLDTERFYVRDVSDPRAGSLQICVNSPIAAATRRLVQGVYVDVSLGGTPCSMTGDTELREIALVDTTRLGSRGALIQIDAAATGDVLEKVTAAYRRSPEGIQYALALPNSLPPGGVTIDRLLITGLGDEVDAAMNLRTPELAAAVTWGGPSCFADVATIDAPDVLAAYGAPPLLLEDSGFGDVGHLQVVPAAGSTAANADCGASSAGVTALDWAHRKMKLVPTFVSRPPAACENGIDDDEDGFPDVDDPGCEDAFDPDEHAPALPCDDGVDNDGDGWADSRLAGGDPGCRTSWSVTESPQCQDGVDNDGEARIDFDGGASQNGGVPLAAPDPQCTAAWQNSEAAPRSCGFGFELAFLAPLLARLASNRRA